MLYGNAGDAPIREDFLQGTTVELSLDEAICFHGKHMSS